MLDIHSHTELDSPLSHWGRSLLVFLCSTFPDHISLHVDLYIYVMYVSVVRNRRSLQNPALQQKSKSSSKSLGISITYTDTAVAVASALAPEIFPFF